MTIEEIDRLAEMRTVRVRMRRMLAEMREIDLAECQAQCDRFDVDMENLNQRIHVLEQKIRERKPR